MKDCRRPADAQAGGARVTRWTALRPRDPRRQVDDGVPGRERQPFAIPARIRADRGRQPDRLRVHQQGPVGGTEEAHAQQTAIDGVRRGDREPGIRRDERPAPLSAPPARLTRGQIHARDAAVLSDDGDHAVRVGDRSGQGRRDGRLQVGAAGERGNEHQRRRRRASPPHDHAIEGTRDGRAQARFSRTAAQKPAKNSRTATRPQAGSWWPVSPTCGHQITGSRACSLRSSGTASACPASSWSCSRSSSTQKSRLRSPLVKRRSCRPCRA